MYKPTHPKKKKNILDGCKIKQIISASKIENYVGCKRSEPPAQQYYLHCMLFHLFA